MLPVCWEIGEDYHKANKKVIKLRNVRRIRWKVGSVIAFQRFVLSRGDASSLNFVREKKLCRDFFGVSA